MIPTSDSRSVFKRRVKYYMKNPVDIRPDFKNYTYRVFHMEGKLDIVKGLRFLFIKPIYKRIQRRNARWQKRHERIGGKLLPSIGIGWIIFIAVIFVLFGILRIIMQFVN